MLLPLADFRVWFPEFESASDDLVTRKLVEAERRIAVDVWAEKAGDGCGYLAAHLLAISPYGVKARLSANDGSSVYQAEYDRLVIEVAAGARVI